MATINKRIDQDGNTQFQVIIRLKGYPTQTATFARITDAKKRAQHTEASIREGRHFKTSEAKKHTLGEMLDRYIDLFNPPVYKKAQLQWWKAKLGSTPICSSAIRLSNRKKLQKMPYPMNKPILMPNLPSKCNAKTRNGHPCKNRLRLPSLRCAKHGGKTPVKHGRKTKYAIAIRKYAKALRMEMRLIQKTLIASVR